MMCELFCTSFYVQGKECVNYYTEIINELINKRVKNYSINNGNS